MEYRSLGHSGLKVSSIGLGTNAFGKRADEAESIQIIHQAIDLGITFIDTANIYAGRRSEEIIGKALTTRRHEVILTTKAGLPTGRGPYERGSSRKHLMTELEGSLTRLKTDYVDLYQIHTFDPETPLEETLRTLQDMISSGKVRYIGASNYYAWELMKAVSISNALGLERYISHQVSYSLADRTPEREIIPMCLDQGIGIIPYYPLAGGILTGKYNDTHHIPQGSRAHTDPSFSRFLQKETLELSKGVHQLAQQLQVESSALSIAWLLQQPAVSTVIVGATKASQLSLNVQALDVKWTDNSLHQLNELSLPFRDGKPFATYRLTP